MGSNLTYPDLLRQYETRLTGLRKHPVNASIDDLVIEGCTLKVWQSQNNLAHGKSFRAALMDDFRYYMEKLEVKYKFHFQKGQDGLFQVAPNPYYDINARAFMIALARGVLQPSIKKK